MIFKNDFLIVNNSQFYQNQNIIDFLRKYGKHYKMATLLSRESTSKRLK